MGMSQFELDSHPGDAVLIAPVSRQIPCQQGVLQGKLQLWADRDNCRAANRLVAAASIFLFELSGKKGDQAIIRWGRFKQASVRIPTLLSPTRNILNVPSVGTALRTSTLVRILSV